jgi:hypothetical protein
MIHRTMAIEAAQIRPTTMVKRNFISVSLS